MKLYLAPAPRRTLTDAQLRGEEDGLWGYCPVYASREAAEREHPNIPSEHIIVMELAPRTKAPRAAEA